MNRVTVRWDPAQPTTVVLGGKLWAKLGRKPATENYRRFLAAATGDATFKAGASARLVKFPTRRR